MRLLENLIERQTPSAPSTDSNSHGQIWGYVHCTPAAWIEKKTEREHLHNSFI